MTMPYRLFEVKVARMERLSPTFLRITFTGPDLGGFADVGYDVRIKLVVPLPGRGIADLPVDDPNWFGAWRALPDERRNPIRTYTARTVRRGQSEVDVDFVLHGDTGPASRWAGSVTPGDIAGLIGPDADYAGDHGGVEFRPPAGNVPLLLAGDETAVPAVAAILERLEPEVSGEVFLEIPSDADRLPLTAPPGVVVTWLTRNGQAHGHHLMPAVAAAAARLTHKLAAAASGVEDQEPDDSIVWEIADGTAKEFYAWMAGESGVIRALRRHLVNDLGLDRTAIAFMGYWRLGRPEN